MLLKPKGTHQCSITLETGCMGVCARERVRVHTHAHVCGVPVFES